MHQFGFAKSERLLKRSDFVRIGDTGLPLRSTHFIVVVSPAEHAAARIGITASRKVGNAVQRNRIKRLVREFFRLNKPLFRHADYNVIARRGADRLSLEEVARELTRALKRGDLPSC